MTLMIDAALAERELLEADKKRLFDLLEDHKDEPMHPMLHKKTLVRVSVIEMSIDYLDAMIIERLNNVPLYLFLNTADDQA